MLGFTGGCEIKRHCFAELIPCLCADHVGVQKVTFTVVTCDKHQDFAILRSPTERKPLEIKKVRAEDIQFSSDLRLAFFTFDLTIQALEDQGTSHNTAEESFPEPGEFELSLLEVSRTFV